MHIVGLSWELFCSICSLFKIRLFDAVLLVLQNYLTRWTLTCIEELFNCQTVHYPKYSIIINYTWMYRTATCHAPNLTGSWTKYHRSNCMYRRGHRSGSNRPCTEVVPHMYRKGHIPKRSLSFYKVIERFVFGYNGNGFISLTLLVLIGCFSFLRSEDRFSVINSLFSDLKQIEVHKNWSLGPYCSIL
jgi:hypothetical protein